MSTTQDGADSWRFIARWDENPRSQGGLRADEKWLFVGATGEGAATRPAQPTIGAGSSAGLCCAPGAALESRSVA